MDIPDVARVVGFMVWVQRYGRVGRNGEPGEAILLVKPSVYILKKENRNQENAQEDADDADGCVAEGHVSACQILSILSLISLRVDTKTLQRFARILAVCLSFLIKKRTSGNS